MELSDERVLVTGGAGFLGSFLCEELHTRGAAPVHVPRSADYDLTEENDIQRMYRSFQPTVVIHLAAVVGGIEANRQKPGRFFYDNLVMGAQLMEYGRRNGLKKFVAIGTICSYPEDTPVPFREEDLWNGYPEETNAPYGMAKKMMLVQSRAYRKQYGFSSIFLLPVNLYGPRDDFDLETSHVIPALIRKFEEARRSGQSTVTLWGTGSPTREFLYVREAARGIVLATERYNESDPVNLGANFEISIKELAETIRERTGYNGQVEWDQSKPDGQPRRCLDTSRAMKQFGFENGVSFEDGLRRTIDWYRTHRDQVLRDPSNTGFRSRADVPEYISTTP
jgi:GDP-L-fucose synthase